MDNLIQGPSGAKRLLFTLPGQEELTVSGHPSGEFSLSGPSVKLDAPHWPVRGDLAHVRLAGQVFVPHYAAPMERRVVAAGEALRVSGSVEAELRQTLSGGTLFNVLEISGGWAWGQVGEDGFVGYLPLEALEERRS